MTSLSIFHSSQSFFSRESHLLPQSETSGLHSAQADSQHLHVGGGVPSAPRTLSSIAPSDAAVAAGSSAKAAGEGELWEPTERGDSAVYTDPRVLERKKLEQSIEAKQQQQETQEIQALAERDREVRTHEQAHMAAGGAYAGAATYQYERGPNGVSYAVAGEVPISTGKEATPEETLRKAQIVRRAALAPAEPSAADRSVAAMATRMEAEARMELLAEQQKVVEEEMAQRQEAQRQANGEDAGKTDSRSTVTDSAKETKVSTTSTSPASAQPTSAAKAANRFILDHSSTPGTLLYQFA
jgi:SprA-related family